MEISSTFSESGVQTDCDCDSNTAIPVVSLVTLRTAPRGVRGHCVTHNVCEDSSLMRE
jgi:hypothetical protein